MDKTPPYCRLEEDLPPAYDGRGYPPRPAIVTVEPTPSRWHFQQQQQPASPPNTEVTMAMSIMSTFCCCLCLGIAAIFYTSEAKTHNSNGEYDKARGSLKTAIWLIFASVICCAITVTVVVMLRLGVFGNMSSSSYDEYNP